MITTIILSLLLLSSLIMNIIYINKNKNMNKLFDESVEKSKDFDRKNIELDSKKSELKSKIKYIENIVSGDIRKGYYKQSLSTTGDEKKENFEVDVCVIEVDRFTNGKSKLKFDYILFGHIPKGISKENIINYVKDTIFTEFVNTKDIDWLESVDELQKMREKKLKRITDGEL